MKSEWRVSSQFVGDEEIYQVYRIRDIYDVDHSGNREYSKIFNDEKEAQKFADKLNEEEK